MFLWLLHLDKQSSQNVCKMWQIGERGSGFCALVHPVFCNLLCFCLSFWRKTAPILGSKCYEYSV